MGEEGRIENIKYIYKIKENKERKHRDSVEGER